MARDSCITFLNYAYKCNHAKTLKDSIFGQGSAQQASIEAAEFREV
jgi:hypothetical protein